MGQFKPMVKMMTTEPSVILKLKKGGKVASKMDGGYMPMQSTMPAQAMPAMPARGGLASAASPMKPSMAARRKAMMAKPAMKSAMSPTLMKKGGKADKHEDAAQDRAMIKKAMAGKKFATGGVVNGQGGFANGGIIKSVKGSTKMSTAKPDHSPANTGGVKLGNGGGYKTGGVAKANGGGYKMGGTAKKAYATGGTVDTGKPVAMPKKPASKPVVTKMVSGTFAKGGKVDYYTDLAKRLEKNPEKPNLRLIKAHTGPKGHVAKVYKDKDWGEHRVKFFDPDGKHRVDADYHTDDLSDAHDTAKGQLNRYNSGGTTVDASKGAYDKSIGPSEEDMDMAKAIRSIPSKLFQGAKSMLGMTPKPAGSVTKTEKSVTVAPASKKLGGGC